MSTDLPAEFAELRSSSEAETQRLGGLIAGLVGIGETITLDGPLGSGKTMLVRGMLAELGGDPALVASPTFALVHDYPLPGGNRLVHVDGYRLRPGDELQAIGWHDAVECPRTLTVIEWGHRVEEFLPRRYLQVLAGHLGPSERVYEIRWNR